MALLWRLSRTWRLRCRFGGFDATTLIGEPGGRILQTRADGYSGKALECLNTLAGC